MSQDRASGVSSGNFGFVSGILILVAIQFALAVCFDAAAAVGKGPVLSQFLAKIPAGKLVPGAQGYGPIQKAVPVAPILKGGKTLGFAFVTSDFVGTTGYSGKPIHVLVAIGPDGKLLAAQLV